MTALGPRFTDEGSKMETGRVLPQAAVYFHPGRQSSLILGNSLHTAVLTLLGARWLPEGYCRQLAFQKNSFREADKRKKKKKDDSIQECGNR